MSLETRFLREKYMRYGGYTVAGLLALAFVYGHVQTSTDNNNFGDCVRWAPDTEVTTMSQAATEVRIDQRVNEVSVYNAQGQIGVEAGPDDLERMQYYAGDTGLVCPPNSHP